MRWRITSLASIFCCLLLIATASSGADLKIGQVAHLKTTDPDAPGPHLRLGIQIYLDAVNQAGGVHGAKIRLVSRDRSQAAADAVVKTRELIAEDGPVALIGFSGTGPMEAVVKSGILEQTGLAVVGIRTGAVSLHEPVNPYLFHTRANYLAEIQKILTQLSTIGLNRIAVFAEDSSFGSEGIALLERSLPEKTNMRLQQVVKYKANTVAVESAVDALMVDQPQAVISIATSAATAEFYKQFRAAGGKAQVVALSVTDASQVVKRIGNASARGLIVAELVPDPTNTVIPLIRELHKNVMNYAPPGTVVNAMVLDGYLAAKTLIEALRIAGPNPSRKHVRDALESMRAFDAGGVVLGFSPTNHTGSKHVELAILLASGKLMR
jgi:branched-chain amino acid transport system substrate-binding protein